MTKIPPGKIISVKEHFEHVLQQAKTCQLCAEQLPLEPRAIIQGSSTAKLLIVGQAPGIRAHNANRPWNDPSGERLRSWLGLTEAQFYDETKIAILPMGFCYPGTGKSGDLPPLKMCAVTWHKRLTALMKIEKILLIGQYAQQYYLQDKLTVTQRLQQSSSYPSQYLLMPHPSPRNNRWLKQHPWFEGKHLPLIQKQVFKLLIHE